MYSGAKKNGEESIKKLADINSKLEGGSKNKLMSFMKSDNDTNSLEEFSKKANEKENNEKDKDKSEKPKFIFF